MKYDVSYLKDEGEGKTHWKKIGVAFSGDKGISIIFDAWPIEQYWTQKTLMLFPKDSEI